MPPIDTTAPWNVHVVGLPLISTVLSERSTGPPPTTSASSRTTFGYRVAPYNVSNYGAYVTFKSATTATSGAFTGTAGRTYCFSVRARECLQQSRRLGDTFCVGFPVDERTMTAAGTWTKVSSSSYYMSTGMTSTSAGATLKLPVAYRRLYLVATKCSGCGSVKVYRGSRSSKP